MASSSSRIARISTAPSAAAPARRLNPFTSPGAERRDTTGRRDRVSGQALTPSREMPLALRPAVPPSAPGSEQLSGIGGISLDCVVVLPLLASTRTEEYMRHIHCALVVATLALPCPALAQNPDALAAQVKSSANPG
jgi:hypothetical protein